MSTLSEFISRRRGVERRQALNKLLNYYIPPNLRPAVNFAGSLTPQASYEGAVMGFEEALTPGASISQRVGGVGKGLSGTAGIAAPLVVAKKAGMPAAQAAQEAFQGFSTGANYAGNVVKDRLNQPGEMPTLYSNPIPGLLGPNGKPLKKEELDPLGYQATKMRGILDETEVDLEDLGENLPRIPRSWEEMENKYVIPLYGDRTSRGFLLKGINDLKFDMPVYTEGGLDFMRGPAFQEQNAVWASNSNIIKRIADEAEKARIESKGEDIFGMTGSMAPNANDFATMTGSAIAEQIKGAKITRKGASDFNELVRGAISSDFPGIRSPKLREWIEKTSSPKRKAFIRLIDTKPFQEQGFPSVGLGRYGVTDITQRKLPPGMFGMGVSKFDELQPILRKDPSGNRPGILVPHSTYNTQITGEYFGSLPPVPQGLVFKDVYDAMEGGLTKAGKPLTSAHKTHAIKTIMPVQKLRPDIIEGILGYVSSLEK